MEIFITIIWSILIISIVNKLRLQSTRNKILISPTDKLVEDYINILKFTILKNKSSEWEEHRSIFFCVNNSENVSKELKEGLYNELMKKGCNIHSISTDNMTNEEKIRKSGEEGEKNVAYKLKWLPNEYKILNNIRLKSKIESQEFDNIIIGPNGIFHIETKNYGGDHGCKIKIDKFGNWVREKNGKESGIDSPEFQLRRHEIVLKENLKTFYSEKEYYVEGIIVISNPKTIIEGSENSEVPVIKADALCKYIEGVKGKGTISSEEIEDIYNRLKQ